MDPAKPVYLAAGFGTLPELGAVAAILEHAERAYQARRPAATGEWGDFVGAIADNLNNSRVYSTDNHLLRTRFVADGPTTPIPLHTSVGTAFLTPHWRAWMIRKLRRTRFGQCLLSRHQRGWCQTSPTSCKRQCRQILLRPFPTAGRNAMRLENEPTMAGQGVPGRNCPNSKNGTPGGCRRATATTMACWNGAPTNPPSAS